MAVMSQPQVFSQPLDVPAQGRYLISPEHSAAVIRTRHLFGLGAVQAALDLRDGRVVVTEPPQSSTVQARFSAASFQSGNAARDAAVLSSRLLSAEEFPAMTFTSTELVLQHEREDGQQHGHWSLRGELEVRGVARLVEARITALHADGAAFRASARAVIDRYDFGITAYRGLAARTLTVDLTVVAFKE
jgi:polyisoprenoid-binding protein YceI